MHPIIYLVLLLALIVLILRRPHWIVKSLIHFLRFIRIFAVRVRGLENIPTTGPAIIVANHISFFDAFWIMFLSKRRVRFFVHSDFFRFWSMRLLLNCFKVIPVPRSTQPKAMKKFFATIHELLEDGELVCVFPEGGISDSGAIRQFKSGVAEMIPPGMSDLPVVPVRLGSLWGRLMVLDDKHKFRFQIPRKIPIPVDIKIGKSIPHSFTPFQIRQRISELGAEAEILPFSGEHPLHTTFAIHAFQHPFVAAFKDFDQKKLSNFSLLVRSILFSKHIRRLDPDNEDGRVGIFLPNTTITVTSMLGVMFADRVPAMLNYTSGIEAVKSAIKTADIRLVLTSRKFLEKLNFPQLPEMLCLEDLVPQITRSDKRSAVLHALLPPRILMRKIAPASYKDIRRTAVVLFSSGSTGNPKGIELSHHNISSDIYSFWRIIVWCPQDRIIGNLPLFHAFGFTVCFAFSMVSGMRTVFMTNPLDATTACRLIREERISLLVATPTFLQNYLRKYQDGDFKSLRLVVTGAEKLRRDIEDDFHKKTGLVIVEGFGCTELSPIVAVNLARSFFKLGREFGEEGSVGCPLPGIHVKIVDPDTFEELPPYTPGLMLVKGGTVMKGYLNEPELTAEAIKDEFYNTGDIAAMDKNGYLFITGRLSRFSKIAGEMVPHELVERAVNEILHSEDRVIAVTGKPDEKRGEKLIVFYSQHNMNITRLLEKLREQKLPNLWIPKAEDFIFVEKIPILGSGKLDLQTLKKMVAESESNPTA